MGRSRWPLDAGAGRQWLRSEDLSRAGELGYCNTPYQKIPTPRRRPVAATALDGRILVMGGETFITKLTLQIVEAYDPVQGTWTTLAPMGAYRQSSAAVTMADGRIMVIAGASGGGTSNDIASVEIYTPSSNAWAPAPPLAVARRDLGAALGPDGKVYVVGGNDKGAHSLKSGQVYDPAANTWSALPDMVAARADLALLTGADQRLYAVSDGDAEAFAIGGSWTSLPPMPIKHIFRVAGTVLGGRIFVALGDQHVGGEFRSYESYDTVTQSWSSSAKLTGETDLDEFAGAMGKDGKLYVLGGSRGYGANVVASQHPAVFDPATGTYMP